MRLPLALLALALLAPTLTADWEFGAPIEVSGETPSGTFVHLESAGRRSLAVGTAGVAIVWEDNRDGSPRVYLAVRRAGADGFGAPLPISGGGEAYEPAVAAVGHGFLIGWEEDAQVRLRAHVDGEAGPILSLDTRPSAQLTLLGGPGGGAYAAWIRRDDGPGRVMVARIAPAAATPRVEWVRPLEPQAPTAGQLYPSLALADAGLLVGWEDRRHGHTRLYTARATPEGFGIARQLNELPPPRSTSFGRGTGVTRLVLDGRGDRIASVWMDKRDFQGGYDIYAALSTDGGQDFGPNELVQDPFGDNQPQWHPAIAVGLQGRVVAVWDDPRDGSPDLWLSWRDTAAWSDDLAVPGAHGPGVQEHPAIAIDTEGRLHLAWVERSEDGSRVRYLSARRNDAP
jgi:hypothetical protein